MMRKILGILNILASAGIFYLLIWLWANGNFRARKTIIYLAIFILVAVASLANGISVIKGRRWILAVINLIVAGFAIFLLLLAVAFASFT